ncbi:MAG: hypothetical protein HYZ71_07065 [Deltaproteobacteria bacterium]|nr:hypothetical protein [Deltaproteobacteria bacterium]
MSGEIRWIVLIQKTPKGPFTTAEVESLIAQGLIRRNDVAFQTMEGEPKAHTGWKFIWQFPDFERRTPKATPQTPKPHEPQQDRRTTPRAPSTDEIPAEIAAIRPDDLVVTGKAKISRHLPVPEGQGDPKVGEGRRFPLGWVVSGVGMAGLIFAWLAIQRASGPMFNNLVPKVEAPASRAPASTAQRPTPPISVPVRPAVVAKPAEPVKPVAPAPRDEPREQGEISKDDAFHREPREGDREPSSTLSEEEEEEAAALKRVKRRRRMPIDEDENGLVIEEPAPEEE